MKYFILIFTALIIFNGCNKKVEEPKLVMPDTLYNPAIVQGNAIKNLDKNKMKTHRGTLDAMMNIPGPGPIPENMLPAKDITLVNESGNSATYTFTAATGTKEKVVLERKIAGADTTWTIKPPEPIH